MLVTSHISREQQPKTVEFTDYFAAHNPLRTNFPELPAHLKIAALLSFIDTGTTLLVTTSRSLHEPDLTRVLSVRTVMTSGLDVSDPNHSTVFFHELPNGGIKLDKILDVKVVRKN